jgi:putative transcriptional regulator
MTLHTISPTNGRTHSASPCLPVMVSWLWFVLLLGLSPRGRVFAGPSGLVPPSQDLVASPLASRLPPEMTPASGKFLVASRQLSDPNFAETVVLLIHYDRQGAMGLVINRPTTVRLATVLPELEGLQQRSDTVYLGGPVARSQMLLLLQSSSQLEGTRQVFEDIYLSAQRQVLQRLASEAETHGRFRVYAGYAGWAPGQLDQEVTRGDWHIVRADAAMVFDTAAAEIWPTMLRRSNLKWLRFQAPEPATMLWRLALLSPGRTVEPAP